ncbi:TSCPD domain protein [compost metagenome]
MVYKYETDGVCSIEISVELDGDTIKDVEFFGGCDGNLKAIRKVVQGMKIEKAKELFSGITCGRKNTSCADQMVKAIIKAQESVN